ncbi:Phosphomannomutase/phosphoglucomutase (PMM / PGM), partial [Durusdinium trenchii]
MLLIVMVVVGATVRAMGRAVRKDAAILANLAGDLAGHAQAAPKGDFTFQSLQLVTKSMRKLAELGGAAGAPARKKGSADSFPDVGAMDDAGDLVSGAAAAAPVPAPAGSVPEQVFREYDIRGVAGQDLSASLVKQVGMAIGTESGAAGVNTVVVARDGRASSPELAEALMQGLQQSGRDVIDLGMVPTPILYYATKVLDATSGVMVTGSHNPPDHNGLKIVIAGETLYGERVQGLKARIERGDFSSGNGNRTSENLVPRYLQEVTQDIVMARPMKVVMDAANGVAATVAPELLRQLGCDVSVLNETVDGNFPGHSPDTSKPENYQQLIEAVKSQGAELGIAFDGDGDRLGIVTAAGNIVWADT